MSLNLTDLEKAVSPPSNDDDFISLAHERYKQAKEADAKDVDAAKKDVAFEAGEQWTKEAIDLRVATDQPILTWNRLHTFVQQVSNDGRQNKPAVQVVPGDGGTVEDSEYLQGRIRQIEYESNADVAYDTSRDQQIISGRGFYRVLTEYEAGKSMRQILRIKPILNQFSVTVDPNAQEYDKSDAEFIFVETLMSKAEYKRKFGANTKLAMSDFGKNDNSIPGWANVGPKGEQVLVTEYWLKEWSPRTVCELANGEVAWKDELPENAEIISERYDQDCKVYQCIIDAYEVLAKTEWAGRIIPIVPLYGRQKVVDGELRNDSLIRYSHDAQRLVNLYVSNIAHQIGAMSKTPQFFYEGQEEGHEEELETLNTVPKAYQLLKPVFDRNGNLLPIPPSLQREPQIQALALGLGQAVDALKASMGIYDASLGNAPADASGLAIQRRNAESDLGNYHFSDNEARSRKLLGRILLELIPKIDAGRSKVPVRTVDGKSKHVPLNKPYKHESGKTIVHNPSDMEGKHEPHIQTGPSYTSQRQEAFAFFSRLAETDKSFMQIGGDVLFRNSDAPGAQELADRYQKMLPAPLKAAGDPSQMQGQLTQATDMVKQLSATVHELQNKLDTRQLEIASKERIAAMAEETKREQIKVQALIAEATLATKSNVARLQAEVGAIQHSIDTDINQSESEFDTLLAHYKSMGAQMDTDDPDDAGDSGQDSTTPATNDQPTGTESS